MAFDSPDAKPAGYDWVKDFADPDNYVENDVYKALVENGYEVRLLGLYDDIRPLLEEVDAHRPDVVFNMVEVFNNVTQWDKNIVALYELLNLPYTGATPGALHLCNDKGLCKKILRYHRV